MGNSSQTKEQGCGIFQKYFQIKHDVDGSIEKYKERFVACGFSQKEGIVYEDMFSLIVGYTSIRTIISLAAKMN